MLSKADIVWHLLKGLRCKGRRASPRATTTSQVPPGVSAAVVSGGEREICDAECNDSTGDHHDQVLKRLACTRVDKEASLDVLTTKSSSSASESRATGNRSTSSHTGDDDGASLAGALRTPPRERWLQSSNVDQVVERVGRVVCSNPGELFDSPLSSGFRPLSASVWRQHAEVSGSPQKQIRSPLTVEQDESICRGVGIGETQLSTLPAQSIATVSRTVFGETRELSTLPVQPVATVNTAVIGEIHELPMLPVQPAETVNTVVDTVAKAESRYFTKSNIAGGRHTAVVAAVALTATPRVSLSLKARRAVCASFLYG